MFLKENLGKIMKFEKLTIEFRSNFSALTHKYIFLVNQK